MAFGNVLCVVCRRSAVFGAEFVLRCKVVYGRSEKSEGRRGAFYLSLCLGAVWRAGGAGPSRPGRRPVVIRSWGHGAGGARGDVLRTGIHPIAYADVFGVDAWLVRGVFCIYFGMLPEMFLFGGRAEK